MSPEGAAHGIDGVEQRRAAARRRVFAKQNASVPPEQAGEVDGEAPTGHLRRNQPRIVRVPPMRLRSSDGRAPPVVRDAQKLAGSPHEKSVARLLTGRTLASRAARGDRLVWRCLAPRRERAGMSLSG